MKCLTLLMVFIAFCGTTTEGSRCFRRKEKALMVSMKNEMRCEEPTSQLVALPVPAGYDYVVPSMAKVKRCSGMLCWGINQGCRGIQHEMKSVKVEAISMDRKGNKLCTHVEIEEHQKCGCGCIMSQATCPSNKVFDEDQCRCTCSEDDKIACLSSPAGTTMWSPDQCICVCSQRLECPRGSIWIENSCSCMTDVNPSK